MLLGIVRGHAIGLRYMEINDGYSVLMRAIQSPVEKLQIKSAFLLSSLCNREKANDLKSTLIKMGLIEQAAGLLAMGSLLPETRYNNIIHASYFHPEYVHAKLIFFHSHLGSNF